MEDELVSNVRIEIDKGEKEKSEEEFVVMKDVLIDKDNNEEDGVNEFCVMKDVLVDKEKSEEDSVDEYCVLKDVFEVMIFF